MPTSPAEFLPGGPVATIQHQLLLDMNGQNDIADEQSSERMLETVMAYTSRAIGPAALLAAYAIIGYYFLS